MDTLEAVRAGRALLPWWLPWISTLVLPLATFLVGWGAARVLAAWFSRPLREDPDAHWTVRAESLHVLVRTLVVAIVSIGVAGQYLALVWRHPIAVVPDGIRALLVLAATLLLLQLEMRRLRKRWFGPAGKRRVPWPGSLFLAVGSPLPLLVVVCQALLLPAHPPVWGLVLASAGTAVGLFVATGGWVRVLRAAGRSKHQDLSDLGVAGAQAVEVLDVREANAIAFPLQGIIAVTAPALELLDRDELAAVLRHEVDHLREPRAQSLLRVLPWIFLLALGWWEPISAAFGPSALLATAVLFFLSAVVLGRVARRAEEHADHHASSGDSPAYARALEKLHRWNHARVTATKRSTHPGLHERMVSAGVTPDWPPPPKKASSMARFVALGILACWGLIASMDQGRAASVDRAEALYRLARGGEDARALTELGRFDLAEGRPEEALVRFNYASAIDPSMAWPEIEAAVLLAQLGRCDEARHRLNEGLARSQRMPGRSPRVAEFLRAACEQVDDCR